MRNAGQYHDRAQCPPWLAALAKNLRYSARSSELFPVDELEHNCVLLAKSR
jgi:hypothetical protein